MDRLNRGFVDLQDLFFFQQETCLSKMNIFYDSNKYISLLLIYRIHVRQNKTVLAYINIHTLNK